MRPPRRLRVLTVARWYPSHDSPGRGSFVADLVRATAAAGVDARVVSFDRVLIRGRLETRDQVLASARAAFERVATPARLFQVPHTWGVPGVQVARLPIVRRPGADDVGELLDDHLAALRPFVTRLADGWRPDVIHAHTGLPDGIVAADVGRGLGIPVVVSEHMSTIEAELADPEALGRYRELLAPGARLLAVSRALAARLGALVQVPTERIGVLPNPISPDAFPPVDPAGRDANALLYVGSLGDHKGIDVLLNAFAAVHAERPDLRLRLVGDERAAGDRARYAGMATSLGIGEAVDLDGWLPRNRVADAMAGARLLVHPSPSETFGVVAAEAILSGLPVVARRSGGVPWIIERAGGFGRVAEGDDVEAFARAIRAALDGQVATTASDARRRLVEAIGDASVARRALALYGELAAARPPFDEEVEGAGEDEAPAVPLPSLVLATGRDAGFRLLADLPAGQQQSLTLIVPAARPTDDPTASGRVRARIVEADPVPPPSRPPSGRAPWTRLRQALWRPVPTGNQLLAKAVVQAARQVAGTGPVEVVAVDAPAADLVANLPNTRVHLAPGALRWLADGWDAGARPR